MGLEWETAQAWHTADGDDEKIREAHAWGGKQERGQWIRVRKAQRGLKSEHAGKAAIKVLVVRYARY